MADLDADVLQAAHRALDLVHDLGVAGHARADQRQVDDGVGGKEIGDGRDVAGGEGVAIGPQGLGRCHGHGGFLPQPAIAITGPSAHRR